MAKMKWVPNAGPQLQAYFCPADELFYGGQAGGGKSDLLLGCAINDHDRSLVLRRVNKDVQSLVDRTSEILGTRQGYNGQLHTWRLDNRVIEFGGCPFEDDKERYKGRPHDLKGFDEVSDFTESQYTFIIGWNRSTRQGQRTRVIATGNPPTKPEGLWVLRRWGAWLDPKHPRPAKPGELRWYTTDDNGDDYEIPEDVLEKDEFGARFAIIDSKKFYCRSRTFIPAKVTDNPDLVKSGYQAMLDSLPAELRAAYRDGNFQAEFRDDAFQLIPTAWINAAMDRWTPDGFKTFAMTAIACDAAGGGVDAAVIAYRHGGWFGPLISEKGKQTADGSFMAGRIVGIRRDAAPVIIDSGGGYGGTYTQRLRDNGIEAIAFNGASASSATTHDKGNLRFRNKRAEAWWRLREALNPDQQGGSIIALPHDNELKADLASVHWSLESNGILLEPKDNIKKRIGRSPDKGDTVAMALSEGNAAVKRAYGFNGRVPQVKLAYAAVKRRR